MKTRSIILTNLNPSVYKDPNAKIYNQNQFSSTFLRDLIINCLVYERVFIRVGDLITNKHIHRILFNENNRKIFIELLKSGAVKILQLDPRLVSPKDFDPQNYPLTARSEDHSLHRSLAGKKWISESRQKELYILLDKELRGSKCFQTQKPFPGKNDFALGLKNILEKRNQYHLKEYDAYSDIDDNMADKFIEFCYNSDEWKRFLYDKKISNIVDADAGFYRTAAYQCIDLFEHKTGMTRLIESVYALCECNREDTDGRYGKSALCELPYLFDSFEEENLAEKEFLKMEPFPIPSKLSILIKCGIGDIINAVRESKEFSLMQFTLQSLGEIENPQEAKEAFSRSWQALCSTFAEIYSKKYSINVAVDNKVTNLITHLYVGTRVLRLIQIPDPPDILPSVYIDKFMIDRIEYWIPKLNQNIRASIMTPTIFNQIIKGFSLRCKKEKIK